MTSAATIAVREDVLRDPRYPVHRIADRLLPYLRVLVEQFNPEAIILFGSYAYGQPNEHSDVDLLVGTDDQQVAKSSFSRVSRGRERELFRSSRRQRRLNC